MRKKTCVRHARTSAQTVPSSRTRHRARARLRSSPPARGPRARPGRRARRRARASTEERRKDRRNPRRAAVSAPAAGPSTWPSVMPSWISDTSRRTSPPDRPAMMKANVDTAPIAPSRHRAKKISPRLRAKRHQDEAGGLQPLRPDERALGIAAAREPSRDRCGDHGDERTDPEDEARPAQRRRRVESGQILNVERQAHVDEGPREAAEEHGGRQGPPRERVRRSRAVHRQGDGEGEQQEGRDEGSLRGEAALRGRAHAAEYSIGAGRSVARDLPDAELR